MNFILFLFKYTNSIKNSNQALWHFGIYSNQMLYSDMWLGWTSNSNPAG